MIKADGFSSFKNRPQGFQPSPLGSIDQVKEKLGKVYPAIIGWSSPNPKFGILGYYTDKSEGYSIEFYLDGKDPVETFMLYVRGGGSVVEKIVALCKENGWKAIDTSTGEFMDLEHPSNKGWDDFQSYRDRIIKR